MSKIARRTRQAIKHPFRAVQHPLRAAGRVAAGAGAVGQGVREKSIEVWQWTAQKYRIRAIVLLLINTGLFVGLGCFVFWLRTGDIPLQDPERYWTSWKQAFSLTHTPPVTLIDFLTYPIPVDQAPFMLIIVGLVLASLTAIPILVSMLYGFRFSLPFTFIICFVAVVPWLAITATFCCFLARWRPLRFSFTYATALISMLPLVAYYALATRGPDLISTEAGPVEMATRYLPWVLALIGACVIIAMVLLTAKLVNYRPGAIAPLMAVLFAMPVALFETQVGRDELYYRLLEVRYGPRSKECFVNYADASRTIDRIARRRYEALTREDMPADEQAVREQVRMVVELQWARVRPELREEIQIEDQLAETEFTHDQYLAVVECDRFLRAFPESRYVPNVLFLKARALDMRVDRAYFRRTAILRHYWDFPCDASLATWRRLLDRPESPLWIVAAHRVALLEARRGQVDAAEETLRELFRWHAENGERREDLLSTSRPSFFAKRPPSRALDVDQAAVLLEARKLYSLITHNRDPQQDDLPLRELLRLNPRHPLYQANLRRLLADIPEKYPLTPLRDNLEVLSARAEPSLSRRIERLKSCIATYEGQPGSDALQMARFELGVAYKADNRYDDARKVFEELNRDNPDSIWAHEARQELAAMGVGRAGI